MFAAYKDVVMKVRHVQTLPDRGATKLAVVRTPLVRPGVPLYHVGLVVEADERLIVLEHGPHRAGSVDSGVLLPGSAAEFWTLPNVDIPLDDIVSYHDGLPTWYVVGVRDCRHHVLDLLDFCY